MSMSYPSGVWVKSVAFAEPNGSNDHFRLLNHRFATISFLLAGEGQCHAPVFRDDARGSVAREAVGVLVFDADLHEVAAIEPSSSAVRAGRE
jgi:hypothetical protein